MQKNNPKEKSNINTNININKFIKADIFRYKVLKYLIKKSGKNVLACRKNYRIIFRKKYENIIYFQTCY